MSAYAWLLVLGPLVAWPITALTLGTGIGKATERHQRADQAPELVGEVEAWLRSEGRGA